MEEEGVNLTAKQMTDVLGVVNKEEFLEMEKKIEKTLGRIAIDKEKGNNNLVTYSLPTKGTKSISVEEMWVDDMKDKVMRENSKLDQGQQRKSLEIAEVEKILSLVSQLKTLCTYDVVKKQNPDIKPVLFRAKTGSSSGLNP